MKAKSIFITILLSLFVMSGVRAQDKYEYATLIKYGGTIKFITAESEEVIQQNGKDAFTQVLKKANELSDKGWDVYNTTASEGNTTVTFYLRKKKN
jgi:cytochrome c556